MASNSIYDIREDKIKIEGKAWDDSEVQVLACKTLYVIQKMIDFWRVYLDRGQELFDKYDGKILTDEQRAVYEEVEDKYTIEPPIMKSPIRSLLGHIVKARKSGEIIVEDGDYDNPNDDINEIATMNIVLKDLETKTKEQLKVREAIHDSLVACYPNVLVWEKRKPSYDNPLKYNLHKKPWNSCVFGPINANEPDLSDIRELVYFDLRSMDDLIENFPEMKDQVEAHWSSKKPDDRMIASVMNWDVQKSADEIEYLRSIINTASGNMSGSIGLIPVCQRIFPVRIKEEVYVNTADSEGETHVILPETWDEKRKTKWAEENKDKYDGPFEKETIVLWRTVVTQSGLVLCNKKHWFQEGGRLPATIFVPCMLNGKPSGPTVDMKDEALRNCVAQIEYLDDMRKGNGMLMTTREGALLNIDKIPEEACKSFGVAIIKKDFPGSRDDAVGFQQRQSTTAWRDYGDFAKQNMYDNTRLNETMQGESEPRQAAIAKENEIAQALITNAIYMDNFNYQWENSQNVKLAMVPHIYNDSMIEVSGFDPTTQQEMKTTVNVPQYGMTGEKESVLNDVTSRKYKWKVSAVDDSPTAKSRMMNEAMNIFNSSVGPLLQGDPSGDFLASFMSSLDNAMLVKFGHALSEKAKQKGKAAQQAEQVQADKDNQLNMVKAQAELEKAKKAGVTLNFTGEQLAQYPNLFQIYMQLQQAMQGQPAQTQLQPQEISPPDMGQQPQPPMMPQEQGVPEMAMA
jgi:hypothetical protein